MHAENSSLLSFARLNEQQAIQNSKRKEDGTYTGKECSKGHTSRYKTNSRCAECHEEYKRRYRYKVQYGARSRMIDIDHMLEGCSPKDPYII